MDRQTLTERQRDRQTDRQIHRQTKAILYDPP